MVKTEMLINASQHLNVVYWSFIDLEVVTTAEYRFLRSFAVTSGKLDLVRHKTGFSVSAKPLTNVRYLSCKPGVNESKAA